MLFALIPAAGKSRRMGRPKLTLPLGDKTVLEHVIGAVKAAGADQVLLVFAPHRPDLLSLAARIGIDFIQLGEDTPDMRATIEHGLHWWEMEFHPRPNDAWLLLPADHPTVDASVIRPLIEAAQRDPKHGVFVPTYEGKRGHPTLIRWRLTEDIRRLPSGEGLNALFRAQPHEVLELPTDRADVLIDMDTPEDYEALRRRFASRSARNQVARLTYSKAWSS